LLAKVAIRGDISQKQEVKYVEYGTLPGTPNDETTARWDPVVPSLYEARTPKALSTVADKPEPPKASCR